MPVITRIAEQKRNPNRRSIHLDGQFAFGCTVNVVAKFRLKEGLSLTEQQVRDIEIGEVKQECFDHALKYLQMRLHSRAELSKKLSRREYGQNVINGVLDDLTRLGYLDDERFARAKALSAAEHKHHGRRRAMVGLFKAGVKGGVAQEALSHVYDQHDSTAVARQLAMKQAPRLRKLDPVVARRRLVGMLQRRGFDYESIRPMVDEILGNEQE
jgi:regulatory protein